MKNASYIILVLLLFYSCSARNKKEEQLLQLQSEEIFTGKLQTIPVKVEDQNFEHLGDYLRTASYIQLAPEPLLSAIKEVQIKNGKIYIQDAMARIICYDMKGSVIFKIDAKGSGPGEYVGINAFVVNEKTYELVIYDNLKLSLLFYDSRNGRFIKTEKLAKPNPDAMASMDGIYYYDNQHHNNYPNDSLLHNSLLVSKNGTDIEQRYFPHNEAEAAYQFSPTPQPFSYNDSTLYYCRNFDNIVYKLTPNGLEALYQIETPNPLPLSKIKEKANEWQLVKSNYSMGLDHIYQCGNLLHFQFIKDGYLQSGLYDLSQKKQIYCGKRLADKKGSSVPVFRLIDGVYKGHFWGVLTPEAIDDAITNEPKDYPEIFRKYNPETDNPIIAFYEVVK
ncbi:6-bladed beta-propeller [Bacteroides sp.]